MRGARAVHDNVLRADLTADLSALFVWSPIVPGDDHESAARLAEELHDPRAQFFWDADKAVGTALKPRLEIGDATFAWDVYCFFDADAEWSEQAPDVTQWLHQLGGADGSHYFGDRMGETLRSWTEELTGAKTSVAIPAPPPENVLTIRTEDLRPIPEVLLDMVLDDLAAQKNSSIDPAMLAKIATELRCRMAAATKPHADKLPRALLYDGKVLVLSPSDCAEPRESKALDRQRN